MNKKRRPTHISKKDWDSVNSPPLSDALLKRARPAREVDPELVAAYKKGTLKYRGQRGPQRTPTKELVSIRLSQDVLRHFRSKGEGWQTRIDRALTAFVEASR